MAESRHGLRFLLEAGEAVWIFGQRFGEHLESDLALETLIAGPPHLAHASSPDEAEDLVMRQPSAGFDLHESVTGIATNVTPHDMGFTADHSGGSVTLNRIFASCSGVFPILRRKGSQRGSE